jgi:hypothetical protein
MNKFQKYFILLLLPYLFSCSTFNIEHAPENITASVLMPASEAKTVVIIPPETIPERPIPSELIMGQGIICIEKLSHFLEQYNPAAVPEFIFMLAGLYIEEAEAEGVNHDIAFAQKCLETGFLSYGGLVEPEWNNFCGLGAIGPEQPGLIFPDPRTGVRAHIQHLKAYATIEPLNRELVDPRYRFVRLGSSPTIEGLAGTWAADRAYSIKINSILQRLYDFSF